MYEYDVILMASPQQQAELLSFTTSNEVERPCKLVTPLPVPLLEGHDFGPPQVGVWSSTDGGPAYLLVCRRDGKQFRVLITRSR